MAQVCPLPEPHHCAHRDLSEWWSSDPGTIHHNPQEGLVPLSSALQRGGAHLPGNLFPCTQGKWLSQESLNPTVKGGRGRQSWTRGDGRERESRSSQSLTFLDPAMPEADMKFLITQLHGFHLDLRQHESSVYVCHPKLCFTHQDPARPLLGDRIPERADSSLGGPQSPRLLPRPAQSFHGNPTCARHPAFSCAPFWVWALGKPFPSGPQFPRRDDSTCLMRGQKLPAQNPGERGWRARHHCIHAHCRA